MGSTPEPGGTVSTVAGAALATAFREALDVQDVRRARQLIAGALAAGVSSGRLYVEVVRPALRSLAGSGGAPHARLADGIAPSILVDLLSTVPRRAPHGGGRAALLSCDERGIDGVDGTVASDYLDVDGWCVERLAGTPAASSLTGVARERATELAVIVAPGPEQALRLTGACSALRRLTDPPAIVLCDFSGTAPTARVTRALAVDAVAENPDALLECAAAQLPAPGRRRWGVRITRAAGTLTLTPTGTLDETSVGRLVDVVGSRVGTFATLVLDLADVASIEPAGRAALHRWRTDSAPPALNVVLSGERAAQPVIASGAAS